jgi:hypothetical protein
MVAIAKITEITKIYGDPWNADAEFAILANRDGPATIRRALDIG